MEASNRTNEERDFLPRSPPRPAKHGQQHLTRVSRIASRSNFCRRCGRVAGRDGTNNCYSTIFLSTQWPQSDVVIFSRHVARSLSSRFVPLSLLKSWASLLRSLSLRRNESGVNDLWRRCCFLYPRTSAAAAENGRSDRRAEE